MNNKYKINFTEEDTKSYITNTFVKLIIERDYPEIIKRAKKLTRKFMKQNVDK